LVKQVECDGILPQAAFHRMMDVNLALMLQVKRSHID